VAGAGQRETAARLGAEVAVVPGVDHSPNTENPGALLDALLPIWRRWLRLPESSSDYMTPAGASPKLW
jgi:pimeloyl-ACP methyl ester carboxylesterase